MTFLQKAKRDNALLLVICLKGGGGVCNFLLAEEGGYFIFNWLRGGLSDFFRHEKNSPAPSVR